MRAQWYDGAVVIPGCDKNMPGAAMALTRVDRPSLIVYGGTIRAGCTSAKRQRVDIVSAFQAYGEYVAGRITDEERQDVIEHACPGPGACGGMYTANTMAAALEALGLTLPYSSSTPADSEDKVRECRDAGAVSGGQGGAVWMPGAGRADAAVNVPRDWPVPLRVDPSAACAHRRSPPVSLRAQAVRRLLERDIRPSAILTREAFENAITVVMALGGSTNAVLHLLAMARTAGVPLALDDFQRISDATPYIANLKPR
jgi:dihydroxy-acid dehydratase